MKRLTAFTLVVAFLSPVGASASEKGIRASAKRLAEEAARQTDIDPDGGRSPARIGAVLGLAVAGTILTLIDPKQPVQPGTVNLSNYLGPGDYAGHSYQVSHRRGSNYGRGKWYCPQWCLVTNSHLVRNYNDGYVDGYDDGWLSGALTGHHAGWHSGFDSGQRATIEIVDANGFVVYNGPFRAFKERTPATKYGGAAMLMGAAVLALVWPDRPAVENLSLTPVAGGWRAAKTIGW